MEAQFPHDIAAMRFDRLGAEIEQRRDFLGTVPFRQQLSNLALAGSQCGQLGSFIACHRLALLQKARKDKIIDARGEEHALVLQSLNGGDEVARCIRLQDEAAGACVQCFPDHLIRVGDRQDDDLEVRIMLKQLASRVQAVQVGHPDVDDDDIRIQLQGLVDRLTAIACLAADLPTLMLFKKCAQAAAHDFVVVC